MRTRWARSIQRGPRAAALASIRMTRPLTPAEPLAQRWQFRALLAAGVLGATLLIGYLLWAARQDALQAAQVTAPELRQDA